MDLFGPDSQFPELRDLQDSARAGAIFRGAQLGYLAKRNPGWAKKIESFVTSAATQAGMSAELVEDMKTGMTLWQWYEGGKEPIADDFVRLHQVRQGKNSIVITGGYSPISGSHGPLTPETVRSRPVLAGTGRQAAQDLAGVGRHAAGGLGQPERDPDDDANRVAAVRVQ